MDDFVFRFFQQVILMSDRPNTSTRRRRLAGLARLSLARLSLARLTLAAGLGIVAGPTASAATPSVQDALGLRPVQSDVRLNPIAAAMVPSLEVRVIDRQEYSGLELVGPAGEVFRRFVDTNADNKIDQWCYFNNNVEVYRDIDNDFNGRPDEYRWLGTEGSKWGLDDRQDGRVDRWKQISAEEVTAEIVAAIASKDARRFEAVLATAREIKSLGLDSDHTAELTAASAEAAEAFSEMARSQNQVPADARWLQFAAAQPGILPAGTDGSTKDVTAYENVVAMYAAGEDDASSGANAGSGQILIGTLVKIGDSWRTLRAPIVDMESEAASRLTGLIFGGSTTIADGSPNGGLDERTQALVAQLETLDGQLSSASTAAETRRLHAARADVIESLIEAAGDRETRETWVRQLVDTLVIAVQTGDYPDGVERMRKVAPRFAKRDASLASYADYAAIGSEYVTKQTPDADFAKVQRWYLKALEGFVDRYTRTTETAKAYLQLALAKEFEENETEALDYYKQVASGFPGTDEGEKAAGAVRRLTSVGKPIDLSGQTIDGRSFRLTSLKGKPVVIHYWATWCEPCKQDIKLLRRLQAAYARRGLEIVGVNVDGTRDQAVGYLRENKLPWTQLFEPGGLESSPLANRLGVQTLPTMMLIDANGRVVRHNVRAAELDDELAAMNKATRR